MKIVILLSGPRGAGKTTYAKSVVSRYPDLYYISRDEAMMSLIGQTCADSASEYWRKAALLVSEKMCDILSESKNSITILDFWNKSSDARKNIITPLRQMGADRIVCWQFITPANVCLKQYLQKKEPSIGGTLFKEYWEGAGNIEGDGFDAVYSVDPLQPIPQSLPL